MSGMTAGTGSGTPKCETCTERWHAGYLAGWEAFRRAALAVLKAPTSRGSVMRLAPPEREVR